MQGLAARREEERMVGWVAVLALALVAVVTDGKELRGWEDGEGRWLLEALERSSLGECRDVLREVLASDAGERRAWSETLSEGAWLDFGMVGGWQASFDRWVVRGAQCQNWGRSRERRGEKWEFCYGRGGSRMLGVCLPNRCHSLRLEALKLWKQRSTAAANFSEPETRIEEMEGSCLQQRYSYTDMMAFLGYLALFGPYSFCLFVTVVDLWMRRGNRGQQRSWPERFLFSWSLVETGRRLVALPRGAASGSGISCVFGVRSLAMLWVMLGHSHMALLWNLADKRPHAAAVAKNPGFMPFVSYTLSVDVFFLLSGLLTAYNWFRRVESSEEEVTWRSWSHWFTFYRRRLVRIWPLYIYHVLHAALINPKMGFRPLLAFTEELHNCQRNWWRNLLFINQWYVNSGSCTKWTWYIGADMTLFAVCPLWLLLLRRSRRLGLGLIALAALAATVARVAVSFHYNLPPLRAAVIILGESNAPFNPREWENFAYLYTKPWAKLPVYLVGVVVGYALSQPYCRKQVEGLRGSRVCLGTAAALGAMGWSVFGGYWAWEGANSGLYLAHNLLLSGVGRTAWAMGVAWLVALCHGGRAVWLSRVLGCRVFLVLANISYAVYLVHVMIVVLIWMHWPGWPQEWRGFGPFFLTFFVAQIPASLAVATAMTLCFEFPTSILEGKILQWMEQRKKNSNERPLSPSPTDNFLPPSSLSPTKEQRL